MGTNRVSSLISALLIFATSAALAAESLQLTAQKVYTAPDVPPLEDAVIVVRDGKIAAVGSRKQLSVADQVPDSGCAGGVVMAGFQNSHVHFLGDGFFDAKRLSKQALSDQIHRMLTRYGYTTVIDTASDLKNTNVIRSRIESSEVQGPRILTAGPGVYPQNGLPIYISHLPQSFLDSQLTPGSADEARLLVQKNLANGADATKLFVATPQADHSVKRMSLEIARAAAEVTHGNGKPMMVHPTDIDGLRLALDAGADVLVHTTFGSDSPWPQDVLERLLTERVAIAPTFKLFGYELQKERVPAEIAKKLIAATLEQFRPFIDSGGVVIFGTDVGYMTDYDPTEEYLLMHRAGMTPMQILAALTTAPARVWNEETRRGKIEVGMDADLVVLQADPANDVRRFADVRCTIRGGRKIYSE